MSKLTQDQKNERRAKRIEKKRAAGLSVENTRVPTRKEMRAIAKSKLRLDGYTNLCKKKSGGKSTFSLLWREWAFKKVKYPNIRRV